jgi:hypothetical protein
LETSRRDFRMKSLRLNFTALALLAAFAFGPQGATPADAQTLVNCALATPCVNGTGPYNTGTGDKSGDAFGKGNANFTLLPAELYTTHILAVSHGGTGASTLAGANIPVFSGGITSGHCVQWATSTSITDSGGTCGSGGSTAFSALTSSANVSAAMLVGTGASLGPTGSGAITANALSSGTALGTPASGTLTNATGLPLSTGVTGNLAVSNLGSGTNAASGTYWSGSGTWTPPGIDTCADASGSTTAYTCTSANGQATTNGKAFVFKPLTTNTASSTLTINGQLWTLKKQGSNLIAGDLIGGDWYEVVSDGVFWQVISRLGNDGVSGSVAFSGVTAGTNANALTIGTGGTLTTSGGGAISANQLNNTSLAGLTTGLLINTTGTGVPSIATVSGNLALSGGVLSTTQPINAQTGTTYAILSADGGKLITFSSASAVAVSLPQATTSGFTAGYSFDVETLGAGSATITPTTSTINGASTLVIATNQGCTVTSDGTNYQVSACTAVGGGGGGSGTITSSTSGQVPVYTAATTVAGNANFTATSGALTLGVSGTAGSVKMGNATSGTVTVQPVTGALGSVTASLPANTGTIAETNLAQTFSAAQTLNAGLTLTNSANAFTQSSTGLSLTSGTTGIGRNLAVTVNDASAVDGIADLVAITCTTCTATSFIVDYQVGGSSVYKVDTSGNITTPGTVQANQLVATANVQADRFVALNSSVPSGTGLNFPGSTNVLGLQANSVQVATYTSTLETRLVPVASGGTTFAVASGTGSCATTSTLAGGSIAGHLKCTGTTGASTVTLTLPATTTAYVCYGRDVTNPTGVTQTGAESTTSVTLTLTSVTANDVISFGCPISY